MKIKCFLKYILANLVNEAAIISARENKNSVDSESFEKASERIVAGLETKRLVSPKEKKTIFIMNLDMLL